MPQDPTECPAEDGGLQRRPACPSVGAGKTALGVCTPGPRDLLLGVGTAPMAAFQRLLWFLKSFTQPPSVHSQESRGSWGFLESFIGMEELPHGAKWVVPGRALKELGDLRAGTGPGTRESMAWLRKLGSQCQLRVNIGKQDMF